jgi:hypothetical protein
MVREDCPPDWTCLHWHVDPDSKRYHSRQTAERAARWLNANEHSRDRWYFRVGPTAEDGRVLLERRWIGE